MGRMPTKDMKTLVTLCKKYTVTGVIKELNRIALMMDVDRRVEGFGKER